MQIDKKTRLELNALSKELFGSSSRWQKLVEKGYNKVVTHEVVESVPSATEGEAPTEQRNEVPLELSKGSYKQELYRHPLETIKDFLLQQKEQLENVRAQIKLAQEDAQAKKEAELLKAKAEQDAKALNEQFSGTAK